MGHIDNISSLNDEENIGVVYLAFGYEYLIQATNSLRSLRKTNPDIPATLVTNLPVNDSIPSFEYKFFDKIVEIDADNDENRYYKTQIYNYSTYDKTLYLDTDTKIVGDIRQGFRTLDGFDISLRPFVEPVPQIKDWGNVQVPGFETHEFAHWNSGVIFFKRNKKVEGFFTMWNKTYDEFECDKDQVALANTMYNTDVCIHPLKLWWNAGRITMKTHNMSFDDLRIFHYQMELQLIRELRQLEQKIGKDILKGDTGISRSEFQNAYSDQSYIRKNYATKTDIKRYGSKIINTFPFSVILGNKYSKSILRSGFNKLFN